VKFGEFYEKYVREMKNPAFGTCAEYLWQLCIFFKALLWFICLRHSDDYSFFSNKALINSEFFNEDGN